jgi:flagellar biosynthesis/type III secretory pathway protein FliH
MDEATDPEKIAQQAKEHIAGAAESLKETASPIADATRRAAETAWNDANSDGYTDAVSKMFKLEIYSLMMAGFALLRLECALWTTNR